MSGKRALVVDDNLKNMTVIVRLLNAENVKCIEVTDPRTLDSILEDSDPVEVVFLDLEMPMVDGFQVLEKLKADSRFDNIPIIAYTVHVSEIQSAHQHGFDGFIGKPLDSDRFPEQLARILSGEAVWETI